MSDECWCCGYVELVWYGLYFDLQIFWWNFVEVVCLVCDFFDMLIVFNYVGLLFDCSEEGLVVW